MAHEQFIRRCFELALHGKGRVSPNPMVGAVLVHDGRIIGEGWHKEYGGPHAEVNCLASVAEEDRHLIPQSAMYVSLEPCAHYGKTPPCANRLVQEQVKEVIICNTDTNDKVDGKGINILKQAGIPVTTGILEAEGRWLNRRFFCSMEQKRPYIILKWAQTADGFFAPADRSRYQVTARDSKQLLHKWRTEEDAIMVGYQTAICDNPQLTTRLWQGKNPLRIALDKNLQIPHSYNLFDGEAETWMVNSLKEGAGQNLQWVQADFNGDVISQLLRKLYEAGKQSLIVEGGVKLLQSFIDAGLWDEARIFTGAKTLQEGIATPVLKDALHVEQTPLSTDRLDLYINKNSAYPFVPGCEL